MTGDRGREVLPPNPRYALPPNRACGSPAHGFPVETTSSGLARQGMGFFHGEKSIPSEVGIWHLPM